MAALQRELEEGHDGFSIGEKVGMTLLGLFMIATVLLFMVWHPHH